MSGWLAAAIGRANLAACWQRRRDRAWWRGRCEDCIIAAKAAYRAGVSGRAARPGRCPAHR